MLEKSSNLRVIPCNLGWSDLGTWDELHRQAAHDSDGNAIEGNVLALNTRNSYIKGKQKLITCVGLENIVVVDTEDSLLVCNLANVQDIKALVEALRANDHPEAESFGENVRPWGSYTILSEGEGFQVKILEVHPGKKLSLQLHRQRSEHWIVAQGRALLHRDGEVLECGPNEHFYIPKAVKHRIENPGPETVRIIEVQHGSYLGEDDIERFEDDFGRA